LHEIHLRLLNGDDGISDMEGKATKVGASEPGKRTSFISSIAMRRQTDKAKEIMRPARLLYIKPQISDLIILKKEPHDEHITRLSRLLRLPTLRRA
jgi:hypothetical protein